MVPDVSIIILNYNTSALAIQCASSFMEKCRGEFKHVIIVDNASSPEERRLLLERRPEGVELLLLKRNLGYTGGNNIGVYYAMKKFRSRYFLLVNADTYVLSGGFIKKMVEFMNKTPDAGFVGPVVYLRDSKNVQNTILKFPFFKASVLNWITSKFFPGLVVSSSKISEPVRVEFINGVCILIRKEVFEQVGFFRENIFMYVEDADFQWRASLKGFSSYFVPVGAIVHQQDPEGYNLFSRVDRLLKLNTFRFLLWYSGKLQALLYAALVEGLTLTRFLLSPTKEKWIFARRLFKDFRRVFKGEMIEG